jgi:hypothetical protein
MFDQQIAKQLWDQLQEQDGVKITSFEPAEEFVAKDQQLVVATVNMRVAVDTGPDRGVIFDLCGVEVRLGLDGKVYLEPGLQLSPELRAVLTHWILREKKAELRLIAEAIRAANQPEPAAEALPVGVAFE